MPNLLPDFCCIETLESDPAWREKTDGIFNRYHKGCRVYLVVDKEQLEYVKTRLGELLRPLHLPVLCLPGFVKAFHFYALCRQDASTEIQEMFDQKTASVRRVPEPSGMIYANIAFLVKKALFLCYHEGADPAHVDLVTPTLLTASLLKNALKTEYLRLYKLTSNKTFFELSLHLGGMNILCFDDYIDHLSRRFGACLGTLTTGQDWEDFLPLLQMIRHEIDLSQAGAINPFETEGLAETLYHLMLQLLSQHVDLLALKRETFGESKNPAFHEWICGILTRVSEHLAASLTLPKPLLREHIRNILLQQTLRGDCKRHLLLYGFDSLDPIDRKICRRLEKIYSIFAVCIQNHSMLPAPLKSGTPAFPEGFWPISVRSEQERFPAIQNLIHLLPGQVAIISKTPDQAELIARNIPGCTLLVNDASFSGRIVSDVYSLLKLLVRQDRESMAHYCSSPYCKVALPPDALYHADNKFLLEHIPESLLTPARSHKPAVRILEDTNALLRPWENVPDTEHYHLQMNAFMEYLNSRYPLSEAPTLLLSMERFFEAPLPSPRVIAQNADICCGTCRQLRGALFDYVILPFPSAPVSSNGADVVVKDIRIGYRIPVGNKVFQNSIYSEKVDPARSEFRFHRMAASSAKKAVFYIESPGDAPVPPGD